MNKFIILWIIVMVFFLIGGYLLNQNEEKLNDSKNSPPEELINSNKQNLNSKPNVAKTNPSKSNIPLENTDLNHQKTKNDLTSIPPITTTNPQLESSQNQTQESTNQTQDKNQNNTNGDLSSNKSDGILSKEQEMALEKVKPITSQLFTFEFSEKHSDKAPQEVKIDIPIKTHTGDLGSYTYSANLEGDKFSIVWNTPGWFQGGFTDTRGIEATYNSIKYSNLSGLEKPVYIFLTKKLPIELTFETFDGLQIPDGTKIKSFEYDSWIESYNPLVTNQKATLYIEPDQVREIPSLSIGQYCSEPFFIDSKAGAILARTIALKKKIIFKVALLDKTQEPVGEHYVAIIKSGWYIDFPQILEEYKKNEPLDDSKLKKFNKTDINGIVNGEVESTGKYYVYIFGPKIQKGIIKEIMVPINAEKFVIPIDLSRAELKLNFFENGKLYQGELKGKYKTNKSGGTFTTTTGSILLNQLESGIFVLHLTSNIFINSTIQISLPESGLVEKDFELKPGSILTGVLNSNAKPILGKELGLYLYEKGNFYYGHQTTTDKSGRFTFTGLNPDITYILNDDIRNYMLDRSGTGEYRASANEVFISLIEKIYFSCLVFDEKGEAVNIKNVSASTSRNNNEISFSSSHFRNNEFEVEVKLGDTISFCIQTKDFASHHQTVVFDPTLHSNPLNINLKKGVLVKGIAFDTSNKPLLAGLVVEAVPFEYGYYHSNKVDAHGHERTALGDGGTFQIENAQIGERYYVLSKGNSPIPFTIEEKHRHELIELKTTKSYSFSGNLRSQKNVFQEGRRVFGERVDSKEYAEAYVDGKGNFYIDCLRPGKWVFTSNFRDMYKVVPRIEIEIIDKDETYDWVVFR